MVKCTNSIANSVNSVSFYFFFFFCLEIITIIPNSSNNSSNNSNIYDNINKGIIMTLLLLLYTHTYIFYDCSFQKNLPEWDEAGSLWLDKRWCELVLKAWPWNINTCIGNCFVNIRFNGIYFKKSQKQIIITSLMYLNVCKIKILHISIISILILD